MQIFVINLDRHRQRWRHMQDLLRGLDFKRIAAVDGKPIEGPERRDYAQPISYEILSRYERACVLSHRAAWQAFLESGQPYCCVLEDDVFLSPDFGRFINREGWLPGDCGLLKIETVQLEVFISLATARCLDRSAAMLGSLHLGTAGYIVSRPGARVLLDETLRPDRPMDMMLFDDVGRQQFRAVYQLPPALCIQAKRRADGLIFPEMESSIQPKAPPRVPPPVVPKRKSLPDKIKREVFRPFRQSKSQLEKIVKPSALFVVDGLKGVRRCQVPFA